MIEATCGACGTVNRIGENDVPVGAKYLTCASCKSRVALPSQTGQIPVAGASAGLTLGGPPPAGGNRGDVIDLADLPAPKKRSPLAGVERVPNSGKPGIDVDLLSTKPARGPVDLDDLLGPSGTSPASSRRANQIADLPAPKAASRAAVPPTPSALQTIDDLPAPRGTTGLGPGGPAPRGSIDDLPAPKSSAGLASGPAARPGQMSDLPAPKSTRGLGPANPQSMQSIDDLPAPRGGGGVNPASVAPSPSGMTIDDLPAPKGARRDTPPPPVDPRAATRNAIDDLPAPKAGRQSSATPAPRPSAKPPAVPTQPSQSDLSDLPAPRGASRGYSDLPMPKPGGGVVDPPTPRAGFDDLPMPKGPGGGSADLPAPKGFFDDLPMPAQNAGPGASELPAPKGFFDDLPMPASGGANPGLPAPKGFFDDLPQSAASTRQQPGLPAPQGFFDDLPQSAPSARQQPGLPAPQGFFDDIPQAKSATAIQPASSGGLFDDIAPSRQPPSPSTSPIQLDSGSDLGLGSPSAAGGASSYDDLDLSAPTAAPVRFETPRAKAPTNTPASAGLPALAPNKGTEISLELEEPRLSPTPKLAPRKKVAAEDPQTTRAKQKRHRVVLLAALGIVVVGGAGGMVYRKHSAAAERRDEIDNDVAAARAALQSTATNHWQTALASARKALEIDEDEPHALGLAAEAGYAGALDDGIGAVAKLAQARTLLAHAREIELSSAEIDRALIVESIAAKQWDRAITKLQPLVTANPKDGLLQLYYGWALAGRGDTEGAIKAYDKAADANAGLKVSALYGRGNAKLASSDLAGARDDFSAVLALQKDHVGAQVGMAAALPSLQAQQQETDLLAILQRKDIDTTDPRIRVQAWVLAGDDARRAGRLDAARDRYNKALAIAANDVSATTGLAETELHDGKLPLANELITKAATAAPNDVQAQIVASEIEIKLNKLDNAGARLAALDDPARGLSPLQKAHLLMAEGYLADAHDDDAGALDKWTAAAKLAGDMDLAPTIAAIAKLGKLQQKASDDKNLDKAQHYREQVDALLGGLADKAATDPALALTLGAAYLDTGDADKAETWLRRAAEARPKDPDAKFLLAKAMIKKELTKPEVSDGHAAIGDDGPRLDDAIDQLRAAIDIDPNRADIGVELARTYELGGRDPDAGALYDKLLAGKDPSVELRSRAGRFYARRGDMTKASVQGEEILKVDPANAAGLYLRGEEKLADGKLDDAKKAFQMAVDADREPQYLDGQGRCAEKMAEATGDAKFLELALRAYEAAVSTPGGDNMFNPWAGQGRILVARGEYDKAMTPLQEANKRQPDNVEVLLDMGTALQKVGRTKDAMAWLAKANKDNPSFQAAYALGQMYLTQNEGTQAATWFEQAVKHANEVPPPADREDPVADAYWQLGKLYQEPAFNNPSAAKANLEKFLGRHPQRADAQVTEAKRLLSHELLNIK